MCQVLGARPSSCDFAIPRVLLSAAGPKTSQLQGPKRLPRLCRHPGQQERNRGKGAVPVRHFHFHPIGQNLRTSATETGLILSAVVTCCSMWCQPVTWVLCVMESFSTCSKWLPL